MSQARKAKDATGRAMFESGKWRNEDDEEESEDEDDGILNLAKLREETEAIQRRKEEERLAKEFGIPMSNGHTEYVDGPSEETTENGESSGASGANGSAEDTATT